MESPKIVSRFLLSTLLLITLAACQAITSTRTGSAPLLTVREGTNCRTGPGEAYEIVFTYTPGTTLEIVGRYDPGNFWVVKSDESPSGTCWMWGEFVDVTGNSGAVPGVTPPPTSTTGGPSGTLFVEKWEYACSGGTLTFTLSWKDQATDETGYRIFRNGQQLVELPADSATYTYTDSLDVSAGESVEYYLQVFGPDGSTNSAVMTVGC